MKKADTKNTNNIKDKEPKTIKVKTVIISVLVFIAMVASFYGGYVTSSTVNDSIERAVKIKFEQLKAEG